MPHNNTLFTVIEEKKILDQAIAYLETICHDTGKSSQGVYLVAPLARFGRLGREIDLTEHRRHMEKKLGRSLKKEPGKDSA